MVSIIVAMDEKRGIGKDNKIPWHIKEDLIRLKNLTKDHVVILGRKTYDSMNWYYNRSGNPMPAKLYIVVTRDESYKPERENARTAHSLEEALKVAGSEDVYILGGGQIFAEALEKNLVDRLDIMKVEGDFEADTFFPDYSSFHKVISEEEQQNENYKFKFLTLEK